ncbi:MAG: ATP-grasp domain-containing protein [Spirochaetota bacterium]
MNKLRVAVSGLNAVDNPGPGVPVLRSLAESSLGLELIGFSYDVLEPGNFMDSLLSASFIVPYPNSGPDILLQRIKYIHSHHPIDLILPTLDSELENYLAIQPSLDLLGIKTFLPKLEQLRMRDKTFLQESFVGTSILHPKTFLLQDATALQQVMENLQFPVFVKGIFYEAYLAHNREEALGYFHYLATRWGVPVIVQQVIYGEECNVVTLAKESKVFSMVAMKKMFLTDKGKAWAGVTIQNPAIFELSEKIISHIAWNGACELEFVIEERTQKVYLLEINPRFPAWIYLATAAGQNMPEKMLQLAMQLDVSPKQDYEIGKVFVRHSWDEIIPMSHIEALSVRGEISHIDANTKNKEAL